MNLMYRVTLTVCSGSILELTKMYETWSVFLSKVNIYDIKTLKQLITFISKTLCILFFLIFGHFNNFHVIYTVTNVNSVLDKATQKYVQIPFIF